MPIFSYQCIYCNKEFDEIRKFENSGKSSCPKCGNTAFKIPAIFSPRIFKARSFADGTKTPDNIRTYRQEKDWMKSQGIIYDQPIISKTQLKKERSKKSETVMESAFKEAIKKVEQGFKIENPKKRRFKNVKLEAAT